MTPSSTFWALVRHEFKIRRCRKKAGRSVPGVWWLVYIALAVLAGIGITTYFAIHHTLRLEQLWYAAFGLPYVLFFIGFGNLKLEWENNTFGWWLTLPYSRVRLIGAKWLAGVLRMLVIWVGIYAFAALYASIIALTIEYYTFADVGAFLMTGLKLLLALMGFSPFIIALGLFTSTAHHTVIRPLTPILWGLFMWGGGLLMSAMSAGSKMIPVDDENVPAFFTQSWGIPVCIVLSWLAAYLIVRLSAYLLEHKLRV